MMERRSNKYDDLIKVFNIKEYEKYAGMNLESFLKKIVTGPVKNDFTPINTIDKNNLAIIKLNKNTISDLENSMNEIKKVLNI